jgi:hypothetical protein
MASALGRSKVGRLSKEDSSVVTEAVTVGETFAGSLASTRSSGDRTSSGDDGVGSRKGRVGPQECRVGSREGRVDS